MQKIVLFDIDGVILKSYNYQKFYELINPDCDMETLRQVYSNGSVFKACEKGLLSIEDFWNYVRSKIHLQLTTEEYLKIHKKCKGEVFLDTVKVMNRLKAAGYKIGILSNLKNVDVDNFREMIEKEKIDYEFYSCYVHAMKPDSEMFEIVSKIVEPSTNEVYFFDNMEENCIEARKFGIKAICATGFDILEKSKDL